MAVILTNENIIWIIMLLVVIYMIVPKFIWFAVSIIGVWIALTKTRTEGFALFKHRKYLRGDIVPWLQKCNRTW